MTYDDDDDDDDVDNNNVDLTTAVFSPV